MEVFDRLTAFQINAAVAFARRNHETRLEKSRANLLVGKIAQMFTGAKEETNGEDNEM